MAVVDQSSLSAIHAHERKILGHPPGLFLLFMVEMWERFSYYGMRALLVLYLVRSASLDNPGRGWSVQASNNLYGWYTGMAYLLPVFGGMIADKLIGTHRSMVVGSIIIALGHVALAISGMGGLAANDLGMSIFIFGLALIVLGTGHFKPTVSVMVGQLYKPDDPRRDGAFTIFYMGINVGAFICAFICGTLGEKVGWHWGFGAAAIGMILGLITYLFGRPFFLKGIGLAPAGKPNYAPIFIFSALGAASLVGTLFHYGIFGRLSKATDVLLATPILGPAILIGIVLAILAWSVWFVRKQVPEDRGPTTTILIFIIFNALFWLAYEQAGSSLNLFADGMTNREFYPWQEARAPFTPAALTPAPGTPWKSTDLYLRQRILVPAPATFQTAALNIRHSGDLEVFINGTSVLKHSGVRTRAASFDITQSLRTTPPLRPILDSGINLVAVHARQAGPAQPLDLSLVLDPGAWSEPRPLPGTRWLQGNIWKALFAQPREVLAAGSTWRHTLTPPANAEWNTPTFAEGWDMPATWFQSVGALQIVLLAPLFAAFWSFLGRRNRNPSQPMKIAISLFFLGGGYVFMVFGSLGTDPLHRASMFWLLATYTMHTLGELCISPTGLSFVTRAAPVRYVTFLMGIWFLSNAAANKIGGQIAGEIENIQSGKIALPWYPWFKLGGQADFFLIFVISSVGAGILMLVLTPLLKKMIHGRG